MTTTTNAPRLGGYLILTGDQRWAWGATPEEAKKNVRRFGGRTGRRLIYRLPAGAVDAWVDDMGNMRWDWDEDADQSAACELVESVGVE